MWKYIKNNKKTPRIRTNNEFFTHRNTERGRFAFRRCGTIFRRPGTLRAIPRLLETLTESFDPNLTRTLRDRRPNSVVNERRAKKIYRPRRFGYATGTRNRNNYPTHVSLDPLVVCTVSKSVSGKFSGGGGGRERQDLGEKHLCFSRFSRI